MFERILEKISKADPTATPSLIISRTSFLANLFHGWKKLSAFQLAKGYSPSVLGVPRSIVTAELLEAHIQTEATRTIHKVMTSRIPSYVEKDALKPDDHIFIYYKSSKQNEADEWITERVRKAEEHIVYCRRSERGPPMAVGYDDIRLIPRGELAKDLMRDSIIEQQQQQQQQMKQQQQQLMKQTQTQSEPKQPAQQREQQQQENFEVRKSSRERKKTWKASFLSSSFKGKPERDTGFVPSEDKEINESLTSD